MKLGEFSADDIVDYLNQELPGFDPKLIRNDHTESLTLRVRTTVQFGAYADLGNELLLPIYGGGRGYELKREIDEFIRRTRQQTIDKLGLQKQIDGLVQQAIQRERQAIENAAYQKAYQNALSQVAREARDAEDARAARLWNAFMGRDLPPKSEDFEGDEEEGWDDGS